MKDNFPPLKALPMFEASGRHLNFRLAAQELNLTQGAVAQQVRGLEAYLGRQLFERKARGLAFTSIGQSYHQEISNALKQIKHASEWAAKESNSLTLSLTPSFASKWLMPRFLDFTEQYPEIEVKILASEKVSDFSADGVDLAIRQGKPPFLSSHIAEKLLPLEVQAFCAPHLYEEAKLDETHSAYRIFERYPLLYDAHDNWAAYFDLLGQGEAQDTQRVHNNPELSSKRLVFNQTAMSIDAAIAGQGLVLAPNSLVEREVALKLLVPINSVRLISDSAFYLVYPRRAKQPRALRQMIDWLKDKAGSCGLEQT